MTLGHHHHKKRPSTFGAGGFASGIVNLAAFDHAGCLVSCVFVLVRVCFAVSCWTANVILAGGIAVASIQLWWWRKVPLLGLAEAFCICDWALCRTARGANCIKQCSGGWCCKRFNEQLTATIAILRALRRKKMQILMSVWRGDPTHNKPREQSTAESRDPYPACRSCSRKLDSSDTLLSACSSST